MLAAWDHQPRTRLVYGVNALERAGELARELGGRRVLLVTDAGLVQTGHADHLRHRLEAAGLEVAVFADVRTNPTTLDVAHCVAAAQAHRPDLLVALGGGSSLDTAKGANFILTNGGEMKDYWGVGKASQPMLPLLAIPTTAGTGSECQCAALIADEVTHQKMACLDPKAAPRVALLDPALTLSQPPQVTARTGVDALTHAVETAVTRARTAFSLMHAHAAFRLLAPSLPRVLADPHDLEARGYMLLGAAFAGTAIENSMLGAVHSAANPVTARYPIAHGAAVGLMLPHVVRFNAHDPAARLAYAELASAAELARVGDGVEAAVTALVARLESLLNLAGVPRSLGDCGVDSALIPRLAAEAAQQWTARFNPRPVTADDFAALYAAATEPRPTAEPPSAKASTSRAHRPRPRARR